MSVPPQERPPSWQQGPWPPQPPPPLPAKDNTVKWLLIAVAILLVITVSVGATLYFTRDSGNGGSTTSSPAVASDVASANDTGPVAIITEDPTCDVYIDIARNIAAVEANGWSSARKSLGAASEWSADQRSQVQAVVTVMRNAADKMVGLAKQTPHRVMRELYEQFIAYGRAYGGSVTDYRAHDNYLADANVSIGETLTGICTAISNKAAGRALAIEPALAPTQVAAVKDPSNTPVFVETADATCTAWDASNNAFNEGSGDWVNLDTNVPASQWSPEQRAAQMAALPVLSTLANDMDSTGRRSRNPVLEDFAVLGSLYIRAYVSAGDSYVGADSWLTSISLRINNTVSAACQAVGS